MSSKSGHLALLKYTNGQWVAVVETGRENSIISQALVSSDEGFPSERVTKLIELGKRIVNVAYGQDTWMVLMQEEKELSDAKLDQSVSFSKEFPDDSVSQAWKEGRRIVFLDYLADQWVLVSEKLNNTLSAGQTVSFSTDELPGSELQNDLWNKEKKLICLTWQKKVGWMLLGEARTGTGQAYAAGSEWPAEKVADRLSKGMTIAGIAWSTSDEAWSVVFNNAVKTESISTTVHFDKSFNEDFMRTLSLTSRYFSLELKMSLQTSWPNLLDIDLEKVFLRKISHFEDNEGPKRRITHKNRIATAGPMEGMHRSQVLDLSEENRLEKRHSLLSVMTDHVLLEDDDVGSQGFSDTNPFAPQNQTQQQGDWRSKLGAFARKAGETVKQHATTAASVATVKLAEAKVKLNELAEPGPDQSIEQLEISAPVGGRRVGVDWNANSVSPASNNPSSPPAILARKPTPTMTGKRPAGRASGTYAPVAHSRTPSSPGSLSPSSSSSSLTAPVKQPVGNPDYAAMTRSSSGTAVRSPRALVFGVSLKIATSDATGAQVHKVPPVVTDCIDFIMRKGLKEEGIFRIGGSHQVLQEYKQRYNTGAPVDLTPEKDVNNISGVLKMYLRELPEHLFTDHLLPLFENAVASAPQDPSEALNLFAQLLPLLPETNLLILKQLFKLLNAIAKMANVNMMTITNLGIIFTQCLRIGSAFFAFLMVNPQLLENALPTPSEPASTGQDLIQW